MEKIEYISIEKLLLDVKNPRFYKSISKDISQINLADYIYKNFGISDLKDSLLKHGYFQVEPMVVVKESPESDKYIVVEGNRRLTTIKILCLAKFRDQAISQGRREDFTADDTLIAKLQQIPVVVAENRGAVNAYLGVRHLVGVTKWEPLAQSKYVYNQIISKKKESSISIQEAIDGFIAETSNKKSDVLSHFYKYSIYRYMQNLIDEDPSLNASIDNKFSFLEVALGKTGRTSIANYLGITSYNKLDPEYYEEIIPEDREKQTKNFIKWVFAENAPISESREINKYLKPILKNEASTKAFEHGEDKDSALLLSDSYENIILKSCKNVHKSLTDIDVNWVNIASGRKVDLIEKYKWQVIDKVAQVNSTIGV